MENFKHYVLSSNSKNGFYNNFKFLNNNTKKSFTYILKGGPGTGKSSLMKMVGEHFSALNFTVEYFHCSSDIESLDGVRIAEHNIAIIDGTAPHTMDTNIPQVDSRIVNLGDFIGNGVAKHEKQIRALLDTKKEAYKLAYIHLESAGRLQDANLFLQEKYSNEKANQKLAKKIVKDLGLCPTTTKGYERKLFWGTADTETNKFLKHNKYQRILRVPSTKFDFSMIAKDISSSLVKKGYEIIAIFDPISPEIQVAVVIPRTSTVIVSSENQPFGLSKFEMNLISQNTETIEFLLKNSNQLLQNAKTAHKKVEAYYVANMDFKGVQKTARNLIKEISTKIHDRQI